MAKNVSTVNNKRHKLYQEIPLSTPYMLYIDPSNACNFKCRFCAMSTGEKQSYKKQAMPFELYKKIIDDLSKFPERLKMIRLATQGEPLLNPHFTDMVRYTKKAGGVQLD